MDINRKICHIRTWERHLGSQHILHQHCYTRPIVLPVRRNPQHRSFSHFRTSVSTSSSSAKRLPLFLTQLWNVLRGKHFPPHTGIISLWLSFAISRFAPRTASNPDPSAVQPAAYRYPGSLVSLLLIVNVRTRLNQLFKPTKPRPRTCWQDTVLGTLPRFREFLLASGI
jgi:hypothetical protein